MEQNYQSILEKNTALELLKIKLLISEIFKIISGDIIQRMDLVFHRASCTSNINFTQKITYITIKQAIYITNIIIVTLFALLKLLLISFSKSLVNSLSDTFKYNACISSTSANSLLFKKIHCSSYPPPLFL